MQVKLGIAAVGLALLAGSAAAQPYYPYHPYWGPRWVAPPRYYPAPVYPPPPVYAPPPAYAPLPTYDHRALVTAIQDELEDHGYDPGPTDGLLDSETVAAIRAYQSDAGLPVTGEATPALLDHMRYAQPPVYARPAPPPEPAPPAYPAPSYAPPTPEPPAYTTRPEPPAYTTRPEPLATPYYSARPDTMRGDPDVAWVQSALQRRGYTPGPADGILGERTRRAIEAFQRDQGMTADGLISPGLLRRLR